MADKTMRLLVTGLMPLLLAACIKTPNREGMQPITGLPSLWIAEPNAAVVAPSWHANFSDPGLRLLVRESLRANFDLKAAASRVVAAKATARIAGSGRWPQLSFAPAYQQGQVHVIRA